MQLNSCRATHFSFCPCIPCLKITLFKLKVMKTGPIGEQLCADLRRCHCLQPTCLTTSGSMGLRLVLKTFESLKARWRLGPIPGSWCGEGICKRFDFKLYYVHIHEWWALHTLVKSESIEISNARQWSNKTALTNMQPSSFQVSATFSSHLVIFFLKILVRIVESIFGDCRKEAKH